MYMYYVCVRGACVMFNLGLFYMGLTNEWDESDDKKCMQFSVAVNMVIINSWRLLALIIYLAYVNV